MKNWKTTLGGILAAAGASMQASEDHNIKLVGAIVGAIGLAFMGFNGKDHNVSGTGK